MHQDLTGFDRREKIFTEEWRQPEGQEHTGEEPGDQRLGAAKGEKQQRAIGVADSLETSLERLLEPLQRVARSGVLTLGFMLVGAINASTATSATAQQVIGQCRDQRTRQDEGTHQRK